MIKKMKWNQILDAATLRYQQIITMYNKGDCIEMEGLCLSSLFCDESELYENTFDEEHQQVKDLCNIINGSTKSGYIKAMLKDNTPVDPNWYTIHGCWHAIREQLVQMLEDWYTDEPKCMITDKAFQIYKTCAKMEGSEAWEQVLAPLAQYMEVNLCEIKAESKEDFVNGMLESLLKDN